MLKNIPPILSPELLKVLCEMGHGDRICIGDGNFPGASMAKANDEIANECVFVRADGHGVNDLLDAILQVIPLDKPLRPDGKLNVGAAVGRNGSFTVSRDIGLKEPYVGSVELVSGEIAEDFTAYLTESEQIPSACGLGVLVDTDTSVKAAGGFLVQLMPGADEALIAKLEENVFLMDQLTTILDEDGAEAVFAQVMKDIEYHIVSREAVGYRCFCSRERAAEAIVCIDPADLDEMIAEGKNIEVGCQFCDEHYVFTPEDLDQLRKDNKE